MDNSLAHEIMEFVKPQARPARFRPVSEKTVHQTETRLGFTIPPLLTFCYTRIGNGGFGPGYGIIGMQGGYASDFGCLVETYHALKKDQESEGRKWKSELLPFCEWGCNIFSCVDCNDKRNPIYTFEDFDVWPQDYYLEDFLRMWIKGEDILSHDKADIQNAEITNPFTGKKTWVTRRVRRR
jgi:hypothetical protein